MITIEEIDGEMMTVVWHDNKRVEFKKTTLGRRNTWSFGPVRVSEIFYDAMCIDHIATALPALPRNPKPEEAPLLYRYMAEGLVPCATVSSFKDDFDQELAVYKNLEFINDWFGYSEEYPYPIEITHAIHNGERVEIAIRENKDD